MQSWSRSGSGGATKIHSDGGALLASWRPYFGWPYGLLFALGQACVCRWLAVERGIVWVVRTWGITGGALLALSLVNTEVTLDNGVALTAGMGALVLAAGLWEGDLAPGTLDRVGSDAAS